MMLEFALAVLGGLALISVPGCLFIQARSHRIMMELLFEHLAESQVLGGTTVGLAKMQTEAQIDAGVKEQEFAQEQLRTAAGSNGKRDLEQEALS